MAQKGIELILTRQLATYLAVPIFLVDLDGNLVFYNEPAERVLGKRFDETGEMPAAEWASAFQPSDDGGQAISAEKLPLVVAMRESRPARLTVWIKGADGVKRHIEMSALPLLGQAGRHLGGIAMLWEVQ